MPKILTGAKKLLAPEAPTRAEDTLDMSWARREGWAKAQSDPTLGPTPIDPSRALIPGTQKLDTKAYNQEMNGRNDMIRRYQSSHLMFQCADGTAKAYVEAHRENQLLMNPSLSTTITPVAKLPVKGTGGSVAYNPEMDKAFNENLKKQMDALQTAKAGAERAHDFTPDEAKKYAWLEHGVLNQAIVADLRGIAQISPETKALFGKDRYEDVRHLADQSVRMRFGKKPLDVPSHMVESETDFAIAVQARTAEEAEAQKQAGHVYGKPQATPEVARVVARRLPDISDVQVVPQPAFELGT